MKLFAKNVHTMLIVIGLSWALLPSAHAHLMVAQHGTLNIVDHSAFMVLSLPVTAFDGVDDDNDGRLSLAEFSHHRGTITEAVKKNVLLTGSRGVSPLQGVMLSPVVPHDAPKQPASALIVMGRFTVDDAFGELRFHVDLFGKRAVEQSLEITATRSADKQRHVFELTTAASAALLFPAVSN